MDLTRFLTVIKRIPLFEGLEPDQAKALLQISEQRALKPRDVLCSLGDNSGELYILVSGRLSVRSSADVQVAVIEPIAPVGEMGMFTGEPRSATVVAREAATFLVVQKVRLDNLLRRNPDLELRVSRNLIRILSDRLRGANTEISHLQGLLADQDAGQEQLLEGPEDSSG